MGEEKIMIEGTVLLFLSIFSSAVHLLLFRDLSSLALPFCLSPSFSPFHSLTPPLSLFPSPSSIVRGGPSTSPLLRRSLPLSFNFSAEPTTSTDPYKCDPYLGLDPVPALQLRRRARCKGRSRAYIQNAHVRRSGPIGAGYLCVCVPF